jgi:putative MATE family efflux protein
LLQAFYNVVDSIWVGHFVGANGLGAVSVSFPVIFALIALVVGLTMATTTLVAQFKGAGRHDMVRKVNGNSVLLLVYLGTLTTVVGLSVSGPLLRLINTPADIFPMAHQYLTVFLLGLPLMFIYNAVSAILRGLGDSRTPLRFLFYATVINVILDPVLIIGIGPIPALGVGGAALATVIAQGVATVIGVRYLVRIGLLKVDSWRIDRELTRTTFRIGIPAGVQQSLVSLSIVAVSSLINRYGADVVAGFGAANRIEQFAFLPAMSVGLAVSALVGQNLGAGRDERVGQIVWWSSALSTGITFAVMLVVLALPEVLLRLFTSDPAVLQHGGEYLRIMAFSYIPMALMFTIGGVMRGAGDTAANMWITLGSLWLVRVPLAWYFSSGLGLGIRGVWWAMLASPIAGSLLNYLYYRTGRWKRHVVVRRQPAGAAEAELSTGGASP